MSNCKDFYCPHFGRTSCAFTIVNGTWKCTKELEGKTFVISTNTTGTIDISSLGTGTESSE